MVHGFEPCVRFHADGAEPAWDSLTPPASLSLFVSLVCTLFLKINKQNFKRADLFTITPKITKCLEISLAKEVKGLYSENYNSLRKESGR